MRKNFILAVGIKEDIKLFLLAAKMEGWKLKGILGTETEVFNEASSEALIKVLFNLNKLPEDEENRLSSDTTRYDTLYPHEYWFYDKGMWNIDTPEDDGDTHVIRLPGDWKKGVKLLESLNEKQSNTDPDGSTCP